MAVRHWRTACGLTIGLSLALEGCVAHIRQDPIYGTTHATVETRSEVLSERIDPPEGPALCRDVNVTSPLVKDVLVRRSFADDAQTNNLAFVTLIAAGIGLLAYGANQTACPGGHCPDLATVDTAEYALLGAAAVPLGFLVYNAFRVRDGRSVAAAPPLIAPRPWHACGE
jgi:hypothetical protein